MVVTIVQKCIGEGEISEAFYFGVLVIIPKDEVGGVRGIGLLEVIHKLISQIINLRMAEKIKFCEEVHAFFGRREKLSQRWEKLNFGCRSRHAP